MTDVFISYSRRDATFVRELHAHLTAAGRDVWVDWEDIPPASQWERDIGESIDEAESFVFVISADSLASKYCTIELARAQKDGKRVVPVACEAVDPAAAPQALRQLNWIWCRDGDDRAEALDKLSHALDTDLEWAREHTRLLVRAVEWDEQKDGSLLLRGRDLEQAAQELAANAGNEPAPTELQQRYVLESRRASSRRQRITLGGVTLALVVSLALGVVALLQRNSASERARVAESQALAARSVSALSTEPAAALADGVEAIETSRTPEASVALRRAILANPIDYVIPAAKADRRAALAASPFDADNGVARETLAYSADGTLLLGLTPGGSLHLWRATDGRPVPGASQAPRADAAALGPGQLLAADGGVVRSVQLGGGTARVRRVRTGAHVVGIGFAGAAPRAVVAGRGSVEVIDVASGRSVKLRGRVFASKAVLSGDGRRVVTFVTGEQAGVQVWDAQTGRRLATLRERNPGAAAVSPDGRFVATIGNDGGTLWSVDRYARLARLGPALRVLFSPDGSLAVAVGENGEAGVWRSASGRLVATLPGFGSLHDRKATYSTVFAPGAAFGPDGRLLAIGASDGIVRVWELATRKQVAAAAMGWANVLAFAPRGGRLAAMTWDGDVVVARAPASIAVVTGFDPTGRDAFAPVFSPDGTRVLAPVAGGAALSDVDGRRLRLLPTPARPASRASVASAAFSADGRTVATSAAVICCTIFPSQQAWTSVWRGGSGSPARRLPQATTPIALDPHGALVAFGGKAWRTATGERVPALDGIVALSPDGRFALLRHGAGAVIVRVGSGATVATLEGFGRFKPDEVSAAFSPDGDRVVTRRGNTLRLWDATGGGEIARLVRAREEIRGYGFGDGGRLVLATFDDRAATFDAADGTAVASVKGDFAAISPDGAFAAVLGNDGSVEVVELATKLRVAIQTDTAIPLDSISFGPDPGRLVGADQHGDGHILRCEICAAEDELLARARTTLALVSGFRPNRPLTNGVA